MKKPLDTRANRIAEIKADLANRKAAYFEHGVQCPMHERAALESELASLVLECVKQQSEDKLRQMHVRQLRGDLLRKKLEALGLSHLVGEANEEAEAAIPALVEVAL